MDRQREHKKYLRFTTAVIMGVSFIFLTLAACGNKLAASTIRLIRQEGTIHVQDESGKDLKIKEEMRFQEGNQLETEKTSLAGVSLDDTKVVTQDELSRSEFVSSGKQIELKLMEGSLFFNVTEPLKDDETFDIKTSTMVLGIRGTSGYVVSGEREKESLLVTDGKVHVEAEDPEGGVIEDSVEAGTKVYIKEKAKKDETDKKEQEKEDEEDEHGIEFVKEEIKEFEIPYFVMQRLVEDDELMQRVCRESGWDESLIRDDYYIYESGGSPIATTSRETLEKMASLCRDGNYDDVQTMMLSPEFRAVKEQHEAGAEDPMIVETPSGTMGVYHLDHKRWYVYYGGYENGLRSGEGAWIAMVTEASRYAAIGTWENDVPNGEFTVYDRIVQRDTNNNPTYLVRTTRGPVQNGLWHGRVIASYPNTNPEKSYEFEERMYDYENGIPEIKSRIDKQVYFQDIGDLLSLGTRAQSPDFVAPEGMSEEKYQTMRPRGIREFR